MNQALDQIYGIKLPKKVLKERKKAENKEWRKKLASIMGPSDWDPNPRHTQYYKLQVPYLVEEWSKFIKCLSQPLPSVFRLGGSCPRIMAQSVRKMCKDRFSKLEGRFVEVNGTILKEHIVREMPFFNPRQVTWQVAVDSSTLKANSAFEALSNFLVREVNLGHIVRQELASMIPALLLDIQSHHCVLDVCAAPGSKTEQLLTLMRADAVRRAKGIEMGEAGSSGIVVANDADPVRINTLKERYNQARNPNLLITCSKAEDLAAHLKREHRHIRHKNGDKSTKMEGTGIDGRVFDRIVADVPCSGDGTVRKFPHIYRLFRSRRSLELHSVQLQIAKASLDMLKLGGRMVYSTCSINPLEDEAVVCGLLRHYGRGRLELIDTRRDGKGLPELISRCGLTTWKVDEQTFLSGEAEEEVVESLGRLPSIQTSMLPPNEEEKEWMHLERCHRIMPHDMDCGGFFVAVLELKNTSDSAMKSEEGPKRRVEEEEVEVESTAIMRQLGYNPRRRDDQQQQRGRKRATRKRERERVDNSHRQKWHDTGVNTGATSFDRDVSLEWLDLERDDAALASLGLLPLHLGLSLDQSCSGIGSGKHENDDNNNDNMRLVRQVKRVSVERNELQEKELRKVRKRENASGIFGSRATGWRREPSDDSDDESGERGSGNIQMEQEIVLMSSEVYRAIRTWGEGEALKNSNAKGRPVAVVQAGAILTASNQALLHDGASTALSSAIQANGGAPGPGGCVRGSTVDLGSHPLLFVDLAAFEKLVAVGISGNSLDERASEALLETIPVLKTWVEREKLRIDEQESTNSSRKVCLLVAANESLVPTLLGSTCTTRDSVGANTSISNYTSSGSVTVGADNKRRLSKAEKKKLAAGKGKNTTEGAGPRPSASQSTVIQKNAEMGQALEDETGLVGYAEAVLTVGLVLVGGKRGGSRLEILSPKIKCESYNSLLLYS